MQQDQLLEKIVALAKRRGFIFPGSEIYGGLGGFYDFGPLGAELKFNIKQEWWNSVVRERDDVVGLSAAIIMNPQAWEASGHITGFTDQLVECKKCHQRFKTDDFKGACPNCGGKEFTEPRQFNTMFKTFVGPTEDSASTAYLRPETAGGIFVNFKNILDTTRVKIPFGIAQIGRAFRNEINPKDFIFRTREFEQMELEYFVKPGEDEKCFRAWVKARLAWYESLGIKNIRQREQSVEERAHYSKETVDIEYKFPFGWKEIEGIANRGDFDLKAHARRSGQELIYQEAGSNEKFVPYVIEPSAGADRIVLAVLCDAYSEEPASAKALASPKPSAWLRPRAMPWRAERGLDGQGRRVVLKLHPRLAPYKAAVFPLLANKPELVEKARSIYKNLKKNFNVAWDDRGNIGKRYYSQDEIGTPYCITVDFQTLEDGTVTIRDRDTTKQERVKVSELAQLLKEKISA